MKVYPVPLLVGLALLTLPACLPPPAEENAAIFDDPPRYGAGSSQDTAGDAPPGENRYGYTGDTPTEGAAPGEDTVVASTEDNPAAGSDPAGAGAQAPVEEEMAVPPPPGGSSAPPANLSDYPFGRPVPGKSGFVTLPPPHSGIGEIDVTGIKPGTPVEIPDPSRPGKKIYFRVP